MKVREMISQVINLGERETELFDGLSTAKFVALVVYVLVQTTVQCVRRSDCHFCPHNMEDSHAHYGKRVPRGSGSEW